MNNIVKGIIISALGGLGLAAMSVLLNLFFASPPTRAEFDTFKAITLTNQEYIKEELDKLNKKQDVILEKVYDLNEDR